MRRALRLFLFGLLAATPVWAEEPARPSDDQLAFFETKIRPVLVTHCYECHAAESKTIQGGLRVDHAEGLRKGGDSGAAIVPGDVEASLLLAALKYDGVEMPPKGKLPDAVLKDFETWVLMGAPDPRKAAVELPTRSIDIEEGRKHWAFQPVANPEPPQVQDASWPLDPLDRFLLAKLDAAGVRPNADADRHTWLRRVSLDLTGLPPTLPEIEAFLQDSSPAAWEKVVDRLLASRGYGERWARHWLDLTGYADQVGTSNNIFAEHAWRYRDYLIDAFNADKPFDRFLREQIAGDLLPFETPQERAANLVATGFLVLGDVEVVNPDKLKMETDHIDQQVSKVGQTFMAMTIGCVRCHDHKFDPVALQDYYGLAGMFRSTVSTGKIPNGIWSGINLVELPETAEQTADREQRSREHQMRLDQWIAEQKQLQEERAELEKQLESLKEKAEAERAPLVKRRDEIGESLKKYPAQIEHARFFAPTVPKAFAVQEASQPSDMPVYIRGNPYTPGAVVPRGIVRVAAWSEGPPIPTGQSGRLQLADWLADKRHPLTARVAVNRVWQKLFGVGLVKSVDYFGTRGELPTHPELLDHLASRFMQEGWSQKRLIRALVLSRAYRLSSGPNSQATAIDPDNRLYWRMNRQRLDAEALRDSLLAVSGQLQTSAGGPSLPLEYPENSSSLAPQAVNPPAFTLRKYRPSQEFERTIYLPIVRSAQQGPARLRDVFDFTQPAQTAGERPQTVVPTQALFLLNNELVRKRATALAESLIANQPDRTVRLEQLWLRVLNRPLTSVERDESHAFLDSLTPLLTDPATAEVTAWSELSHALLSSNEFIHRL
jgi:hypothetical protein